MAKTVNLKASDLASGQTAQFRDLTFTPAGGSATTVKALMTAAVTIPASGSSMSGFTETRVPVAWRVNPTTHAIEYKTGIVPVKDGSTDESWTELLDFDAYDV